MPDIGEMWSKSKWATSERNWNPKGTRNIVVRTQKFVCTKKGAKDMKNIESLKDFLENKSQTIELSAKIESIGIGWCAAWAKTRHQTYFGWVMTIRLNSDASSKMGNFCTSLTRFYATSFFVNLWSCSAVVSNEIQKFKSKYCDSLGLVPGAHNKLVETSDRWSEKKRSRKTQVP